MKVLVSFLTVVIMAFAGIAFVLIGPNTFSFTYEGDGAILFGVTMTYLLMGGLLGTFGYGVEKNVGSQVIRLPAVLLGCLVVVVILNILRMDGGETYNVQYPIAAASITKYLRVGFGTFLGYYYTKLYTRGAA
jgi:hypothetical protein